ncbi:hypothetical protein KR093_010241 [Drosophila rubida]|uniref:Cytochrome c oxidase subunit 7A1, mitochondrial n=1 Tax=Drosophila rubida TaxID=30044 RepID=A0AAD4K7K0_9MUSC|nr:hypothetical protein KR093_010241 [Drosophila rubida]
MLIASRSLQPSPQVRRASGAGKLPPKMAKLQKQYQVDNGLPVFLKGGPLDNILYRGTVGLSILGLVGDLWLFAGYIIA